MDQESSWAQEALDEFILKSRDYKQKALLFAAKDLLAEQSKRKQHLEAELDAKAWSPNQWESR